MVADEATSFCERGADPVRAHAGRLDARSRQHRGEFLAADPAEYVVRPERRGGHLAELADDVVADRMAVCVVAALNRSRSNITTETGALSRGRRAIIRSPLSMKAAPVCDACQRVDVRGRPGRGLIALLDQGENEHGGAEREDDAFQSE